jgi:hypothetical protein
MKKLITLLLLLSLTPVALPAQAPVGFAKLGNVTVLTYTDTTCPDQTTCYYVVTAVDSLGGESQPATCAFGQLCVNGVQAVAQMPSSGTHTVVLTWTASVTAGVTYNVYSHIGPLPASNVKAVVN